MKIHRHLFEELAHCLDLIFHDQKQADKVIERTFKEHKKWGARDRRFFAETLYNVVRYYRFWQAVAETSSSHLIIGAYLFDQAQEGETLPDWEELHWNHQEMQLRKEKWQKNPAVRESFPDWLYELGQKEFGSVWKDLAKALNQPAEVYLRVNALKSTVPQAIESLSLDEIQAEAIGESLPWAIKLKQRKNIFISKGFHAGLFEVQDGASQMIAPLLAAKPGDRVIDACAGGGGKSLHIASMMKNKGKILALDIHDWKLQELKKRARRGGVDIIETRLIDSSKVIKRMHGTADKLLLDVPCTGLGVLRRNPDKKWKLQPEHIQELVALQKEILLSYSKMVKVNGQMVYATCSFLPDENERQVAWFMQKTEGQFKLLREIHVRPDIDGHDGFYAALLERIGSSSNDELTS